MFGTYFDGYFLIQFDSQEGADFTHRALVDGCLPGIWGDGAYYGSFRVGTIIRRG